MSNVKLVYCFSKKLSFSDEQYSTSLNLLKKSVELSSKHYPVKIYTDKYTIEDIYSLNVEIITLENLDLIFVDDFKLYIQDLLLDNELFIDSDVLVYKEISLDFSKDLIFDFIDSPNSPWYIEGFNKLDNTNIKNILNEIGTPEIVPNLGFLKITDKSLLDIYKNYYYQFRSYLLKEAINIKPVSQFSMILGQYLLGAVLSTKNYSYISIHRTNDRGNYRHLSGPSKFRKHRKQQII